MKEALKELARVILLSIIPITIVQLENKMFDWQTIILVGSIAGLRFVDKYLHEVGKAENDPRLTKGLTQF